MGGPSAQDSVCAIVVTYHPDLNLLNELLVNTAPQVERLVVVDNGSSGVALAWLRQQQDGGLAVLELGDNLGIATAHNRGIEWAREQGFRHVLLLDQDSVPAPHMVKRLLAALHTLQARGEPVAAVGPRCRDPRLPTPLPFIRWGFLRNQHLQGGPETGTEPVSTDFLISSGTLIPLTVLARVGGMEEALFLYYVDCEWCLRAAALGYRLYGAHDAEMRHRLGDRAHPFWFLGGRRVIERSPLALYYLVRNRLLLYRRPYALWLWIGADLLALLFTLMAFTLFLAPRVRNAAMMGRGLWHGFLGRGGRHDTRSRRSFCVRPLASLPG